MNPLQSYLEYGEAEAKEGEEKREASWEVGRCELGTAGSSKRLLARFSPGECCFCTLGEVLSAVLRGSVEGHSHATSQSCHTATRRPTGSPSWFAGSPQSALILFCRPLAGWPTASGSQRPCQCASVRAHLTHLPAAPG